MIEAEGRGCMIACEGIITQKTGEVHFAFAVGGHLGGGEPPVTFDEIIQRLVRWFGCAIMGQQA